MDLRIPEEYQLKMKNGGFRYGVKPRGPLSKRRLLSANRSFKNACEKKDQLRSSPTSQKKRGHNKDDSHHSSSECEDVFANHID